MKTYKKGTLIIKRYKKGMTVETVNPISFEEAFINLSEEEIKILKEYFRKEV